MLAYKRIEFHSAAPSVIADIPVQCSTGPLKLHAYSRVYIHRLQYGDITTIYGLMQIEQRNALTTLLKLLQVFALNNGQRATAAKFDNERSDDAGQRLHTVHHTNKTNLSQR